MSSEITANIDVASVVLYMFWAFFFGLIFWLRRDGDRFRIYRVLEDFQLN